MRKFISRIFISRENIHPILLLLSEIRYDIVMPLREAQDFFWGFWLD